MIVGALGIIWGVMLVLMRPRLLEFSREGGRGLRDMRVINVLVVAAAAFLCAGGVTVVLLGIL
ncbi:MAG: hypothetical protein PHS26_02110 [Actinomycetota bacterium]|nr:hypothetical protein [Actinomycetota bacterium]